MLLSCFIFLVFFSNNRCIFYLTNNNDQLDTDTFYGPVKVPALRTFDCITSSFFHVIFWPDFRSLLEPSCRLARQWARMVQLCS